MLTDVLEQLNQPFDMREIQIRPGAVSADGSRALALAYADWRAYADRLDAVVGPENWSIRLVPWGDHRLIAELTIFGITKAATGEGNPHDENAGTIAEAQAKKRACAEFGLGRYFYHLPKVWGSGSGDRRTFRFADGEEQRIIHQMYATLGLTNATTSRRPEPAPTTAADPERLARAREAMADAEQRASRSSNGNGHHAGNGSSSNGSNGSNGALATERQLRAIATLARQLDDADLDEIGTQAGVTNLSKGRKNLDRLALSKTQASNIIGALQHS
jgi:hypothetical protein